MKCLFSLLVFGLCACSFSFAENAYWVGGSGSWSDYYQHWAAVSGGDPTGFGKVPDAGTNVIIDDNSFGNENTLHITVSNNAECYTLDFSEATKKVIFSKGSTPILKIYGSLVLNPIMEFNCLGKIDFESSPELNAIHTHGIKLPKLFFYGDGGSWELHSELHAADINFMTQNHFFDTKGFGINCNHFNPGGVNGVVKLNNSNITVSGNWNSSSLSEFDAGTSFIEMKQRAYFSAPNQKLNIVHFTNATRVSEISNNTEFAELKFAGDGVFRDDATIGTLILSKNKEYQFASGKTYTFTKEIVTDAACDGYLIMASSNFSSPAYFKSSIPINIDYAILGGISYSGAGFAANNSVEMQGVSGISFNGVGGRNLYWVAKGTADWDNPSSWSETKGGAPGACIPSPIDNVFIEDLISTDEVVISSGSAYCNDINWLNCNGVAFTPNSARFRCFGSLVMDGVVNTSGNCDMMFLSIDKDEIIDTRGNKLKDVRFQGSGAWTLKSDLYTDAILHERGSVHTENNNISCNTYSGNSQSDKELHLGTSEVTVRESYFIARSGYDIFDGERATLYMEKANSYVDITNKELHKLTFLPKKSTNTLHNSAYIHKLSFNANGLILDNCEIDTLLLSSGFKYAINQGGKLTVNDSLSAVGDCDSVIYIGSSSAGSDVNIISNMKETILDYTVIQDVDLDANAPFIAKNSLDMGNNSGITFEKIAPRDLYWIGKDNANWSNRNNWSLAESGAGGECLPTPVDNVFITSMAATDILNLDMEQQYCKDIIFSDQCEGQLIGANSKKLNIHGSLKFSDRLSVEGGFTTIFKGEGLCNIKTAGNKLFPLIFENRNGFWELQDSLECQYFLFRLGNFKTNGHNVSSDRFQFIDKESVIDISNSTIRCKGAHWILPTLLNQFISEGSTILLENKLVYLSSGDQKYNSVIFTNPAGEGRLEHAGIFNRLEFKGNAQINNSNTIDSLILTPGYNYTFSANHTQTIKKGLEAKGNSCYPITLESDNPKTKTTISKADGSVSCDFLSVTDIHVGGGAKFYAGEYTEAIGDNNYGWIWDNSPDYVYGFGNDTTMCEGDILNTFNFNGAEDYLWHDGVTTSNHKIDKSGLYWVQVRYSDDCIFRDSINIEIINNSMVNAGEDILVCEGNTKKNVTADIENALAPYTIQWEPAEKVENANSNQVIISSDISEDFIISVENAKGCIAQDTIKYIVLDGIKPVISFDGEYLISSIDNGNQWYFNGDKIPGAIHKKLLPIDTGSYTLEVTNSYGCKSEMSEPYLVVIPDYAMAILSLSSGSAYPGEIFNLDVSIENGDELFDLGVTAVDLTLEYNPSLLHCSDYETEKLSNSKARMSIAGINMLSKDSTSMITIPFTVALGNSESTYVSIVDYRFYGAEDYRAGIKNGKFSLLGICEQGGKRLLEPNGKAEINLSAIITRDSEFTVQTAEAGIIQLEIYDCYGKKVEVFENKYYSDAFSNKYSLDISKYHSGAYFIIMRSPTIIRSKKFIIIK